MKKYLYIFTYEKPGLAANQPDPEPAEEGSEAVFIEATDPEEALAWGNQIAREFVNRLGPEPGDWNEQKCAHWLELDPASEYPAPVLVQLPVVRVGVHPNWHTTKG